ncbi:M1 family metallopeptidase [Mucilaginibacter myungsuensis]|uniref:M1 family metallopeptidase n=1 Tax=Mucilaginibacter myungsuensis TaxID=649104 RepID=A0A929L050_9SPHI|nr:M1 family metallopeptidase [Mucilaginibacter myungsuensis]MBE9662054.1 M1 family metallopeptidase [Mucilaginibacter myungsuensis]MDN3599513.1 M1 family metallopeptidase [Mucilaginibacter myungsuensis]
MKLRSALGLLMLLIGIAPLSSQAQLLTARQNFTRKDSLQGNQNAPLRTCYDINYYHLDVKFDIVNKFISGSNLFRFTATRDMDKLQFDLFDNLKIEKVLYKGKELTFKREFNAVFLDFPGTIKAGAKDEFTVFYSGNPTIAKNPPWDGGVAFKTDSLGKPWISTACEGIGASIWWPNKDQMTDEADSILISISVPKGLKDVSNGRLRKVTELKDGYTRFDWFVGNKINNYNVEANIGDYVHFSDSYMGEKGKLTLDYWVLPYNLERAKKQFAANVKPMLKAFEYWFGPYPFYEDGYKLIETSHLGMEHQSGVAYGNKYRNGYLGRDLSGTGHGLNWDFIVVHESGHEWFGNNITNKDVADMWIHEGFTNYSESLFIEHFMNSKEKGIEYVHGTRRAIQNDQPIIGTYGVNKEGSGDMYYKGGNLLNMVRTIINDDEKWRAILRGLNKTFYHQTTTTEAVVKYINDQASMNLTPIFDQYLRYKHIPTLEFRFENGTATARWISEVRGFNMPVRVRTKGGKWKFITPTTRVTPINVQGLTKENLEVDTLNYYIGVLVE